MTIVVSEICPKWTTFFGFMGAACSLIFANFGSCYGTAKAGVGVMVMGVMHPQLIVKSTLPTILAGVLYLIAACLFKFFIYLRYFGYLRSYCCHYHRYEHW